MEYTDLLLVDIKHIDPHQHRLLTGKSNENILDMLKYLDEIHQPVWIRHVLVPGITDDDTWLHQTRAFLSSLHNIERIDVLPYHTLGIHKYEALGIPYSLAGVNPPSAERIENARRILNGEQAFSTPDLVYQERRHTL